MNLVEKYKDLEKNKKKKFRRILSILSCQKDCAKCNKTTEQCIIEMRSLIEFLIKKVLKTNKKSLDSDSMVS